MGHNVGIPWWGRGAARWPLPSLSFFASSAARISPDQEPRFLYFPSLNTSFWKSQTLVKHLQKVGVRVVLPLTCSHNQSIRNEKINFTFNLVSLRSCSRGNARTKHSGLTIPAERKLLLRLRRLVHPLLVAQRLELLLPRRTSTTTAPRRTTSTPSTARRTTSTSRRTSTNRGSTAPPNTSYLH